MTTLMSLHLLQQQIIDYAKETSNRYMTVGGMLQAVLLILQINMLVDADSHVSAKKRAKLAGLL